MFDPMTGCHGKRHAREGHGTEPELEGSSSRSLCTPVFKGGELEKPAVIGEEENNPLVPTKRTSRHSSKYGSDVSSEAGI